MYTQRTKCTVRISKLVLYSVTDLHNDANFSLIRLGSILASIERTRLLAQSVCAHLLETGSHSTHQVSLVGNRRIELRKKEKEMQ